MPKITGNTVGVPNPKPDWKQTDETKADYIKNKPDIYTKKEINTMVGNIEAALDIIIAEQESIIAMQEAFIAQSVDTGGVSV